MIITANILIIIQFNLEIKMDASIQTSWLQMKRMGDPFAINVTKVIVGFMICFDIKRNFMENGTNLRRGEENVETAGVNPDPDPRNLHNSRINHNQQLIRM